MYLLVENKKLSALRHRTFLNLQDLATYSLAYRKVAPFPASLNTTLASFRITLINVIILPPLRQKKTIRFVEHPFIAHA